MQEREREGRAGVAISLPYLRLHSRCGLFIRECCTARAVAALFFRQSLYLVRENECQLGDEISLRLEVYLEICSMWNGDLRVFGH